MDTRDILIAGLLAIVILLLLWNLMRTRVDTKFVTTPGGNPLIVLDRPYYYTNPVASYINWPYGYYGYWPYGYGSGGYSGGIRSGGGYWGGGGGGGGGHHHGGGGSTGGTGGSTGGTGGSTGGTGGSGGGGGSSA